MQGESLDYLTDGNIPKQVVFVCPQNKRDNNLLLLRDTYPTRRLDKHWPEILRSSLMQGYSF